MNDEEGVSTPKSDPVCSLRMLKRCDDASLSQGVCPLLRKSPNILCSLVARAGRRQCCFPPINADAKRKKKHKQNDAQKKRPMTY